MFSEKIEKNFSKYSVVYNKYSYVQKIMSEILIELIKKENGCFNKVFEIGCGTGIFSELFLDNFKIDSICLNDISSKMLEEAKKRILLFNTEFICCDFEDFKPENSKYDLVISNAAFQWFKDLDSQFNKINNLLLNDGVLAFTTFIDGTFYELDRSFISVYNSEGLPYNKHILNFYKMEKINELLENNGFVIKEYFTNDFVYYFKSPLDFLKSVKNIGASGITSENLKYSIMKKMFNCYEKLFLSNNKMIPATYKTYFCIAVKK